jgi:hypothetical protein
MAGFQLAGPAADVSKILVKVANRTRAQTRSTISPDSDAAALGSIFFRTPLIGLVRSGHCTPPPPPSPTARAGKLFTVKIR